MTPPEFLVDLVGQDSAETITQLTIAALIIVLTVLLVGRIAAIIIRFATRLTKRTSTQLDDQLINGIEPPLRFLVAVIGIWVALTTLDMRDEINRVVHTIATTLIAVAIFWGIYRIVDVIADALVEYTEKDPRFDHNLVRFGRQIAKAVVLIFLFVVIMDQLGYNLNGLLAGLGIGGLAIALAAQDALSNLIGYFVIIGDSPFNIGDFVETDSATGVVENIGFRSTRFRALDQSLIIVPNGTVANSSITNWSRLTRRRLDMTLGITYTASSEQILSVVQAVREMLDAHPSVIEDTVFVQFVNFGDSALELRIICYLDRPIWTQFQTAKEDINLRIMQLLHERGVELAFPTQTVVVQQAAPPPEPTVPLSPSFPQTDDTPHDTDMELPQPE